MAMAICLSACGGNQKGAQSTTSSASVSESTSAEAASVTETTSGDTTSETANTVTSLKDDFYLWVNKDWLATAKIPEGMESVEINPPADTSAELKQALTENIFSDHDARQAQLLFKAFSDTDAHAAAGAAPVKKVIDDISSVSGIDELDAFLLDTERSA